MHGSMNINFENDLFLMRISSQKFKLKICVSKVGIGIGIVQNNIEWLVSVSATMKLRCVLKRSVFLAS